MIQAPGPVRKVQDGSCHSGTGDTLIPALLCTWPPNKQGRDHPGLVSVFLRWWCLPVSAWASWPESFFWIKSAPFKQQVWFVSVNNRWECFMLMQKVLESELCWLFFTRRQFEASVCLSALLCYWSEFMITVQLPSLSVCNHVRHVSFILIFYSNTGPTCPFYLSPSVLLTLSHMELYTLDRVPDTQH